VKDLTTLNEFRRWEDERRIYGVNGGRTEGLFAFASIDDGQRLTCIASVGGDWEHVSVSRGDRCPTYAEMEQVADRMFLPSETWMQLHVPKTEHVNVHPFCLHWWKPMRVEIPVPPKSFVG
jgi:hypothetical protein